MTTVLSQKGRIVIPVAVRQQLRLKPGDKLEVTVENEDTITLRRVLRPDNRGLLDLLLACPSHFEVAQREVDDASPPAL